MSLPYPLEESIILPSLSVVNVSDPTFITIKSILVTLNTNIDSFNNETSDTNKLDTYSRNIQNSSKSLLNLISECASSIDPNKCDLPICKYSDLLVSILIIIGTKLSTISTLGIKKKYKFMNFILFNSLASSITSNSSNLNISSKKYMLCNSSTVFIPPDPTQPLFSTFQELVEEAQVQEQNRDTRIATNDTITYLTYGGIGLVVIIIIIILYNYYGKKPIEDLNKKLGGFINKMFK
jgi:hypothetical protein